MHAYPCYSFISISPAPVWYISSIDTGILNSTTIFVYLAEFGMAKRSATSELNHENWNEKEVREEAGTFCKASPDVMQHRVIRSAKRRSVGITESVSTDLCYEYFQTVNSVFHKLKTSRSN
jgi:hypothetical protein